MGRQTCGQWWIEVTQRALLRLVVLLVLIGLAIPATLLLVQAVITPEGGTILRAVIGIPILSILVTAWSTWVAERGWLEHRRPAAAPGLGRETLDESTPLHWSHQATRVGTGSRLPLRPAREIQTEKRR